MKNPMNAIKHIKTADVFDFNCVGFPAAWSDIQVLVCGRALRNYDDMKDDNDRLVEENAKLRELLERSIGVVSFLNVGYNQDINADRYMDSAKQLLNQLKDKTNDK